MPAANSCGMRRGLALLSYYLGVTLGLGTILKTARHADLWQFPLVPLLALPIWWIAAGIGVRLGVHPADFFRSISRALGLVDQSPATTPDTPK